VNAAGIAFDRVAGTYDARWTNAPAGRLQRDAVWRVLDPLIKPGMRVLDLGCGTGEDALYLKTRGADIDAVDSSPEMVRIAREKGLPARVLAIENVERIAAQYDAVLSNFGALNCVEDLPRLGRTLERLVRPGGYAILCLLNRMCAWETAYYAARGEWRKSVRRMRGVHQAGMGVAVYYHSAYCLRKALAPAFSLQADHGIGVAVPPSYGPALSPRSLKWCARFDRWAGTLLAGRTLSDHRLLVFTRN